MLEPWLQSKGLNDADQVLAYFAVSKLGEAPVDGKTDTNPEGLTAAYGKWASAIATRLHAGGLSCKVKETFSLLSSKGSPMADEVLLDVQIYVQAFILLNVILVIRVLNPFDLIVNVV